MYLTDILIIGLVALFIIQLFVFYKIVMIVRQFTRLLLEVRLLFRHAGISYEHNTKKIVDLKTCQFCKYRLPYIKISENDTVDDFYHKCKKKDIEINLNDTCNLFERDLLLK